MVLKLFSAFAGYGTDNFALKRIGIKYECVGYSEIDKYAIICFQQNHGSKNYGDISNIDWNTVPDFDIITGGFPCQDVSVAGHQDLTKGRTILGLELTKALEIKKPKYFLFENVKGLMNKKFDIFRNTLISSWGKAGYKIYYHIMNTKEYGIPQNRERVFFVGIRNDIQKEYIFPEKEELKIFIKDILEKDVDSKYLLKEKQIQKLLEGIESKNKFKQSQLQIQNYSFALKSRDYKDPKVVQIDISGKGYKSQQDRFYNTEGVMCCLPNAHPDNKVNIFALRGRNPENQNDRTKGIILKQTPEFKEDGCSNSLTSIQKDNLVLDNRYKDKARMYNGVVPTLNSHGDTQGGVVTPIVMNCLTEAQGRQGSSSEFLTACNFIQKEIGLFRRLTPKECFRLQGFLNDEINISGLSDTQAYKLAGNGQSVNVVEKILKNLLDDSGELK